MQEHNKHCNKRSIHCDKVCKLCKNITDTKSKRSRYCRNVTRAAVGESDLTGAMKNSCGGEADGVKFVYLAVKTVSLIADSRNRPRTSCKEIS